MSEDKDKLDRLEAALLAFVERATKERAAPNEVGVLAAVADVLAKLLT